MRELLEILIEMYERKNQKTYYLIIKDDETGQETLRAGDAEQLLKSLSWFEAKTAAVKEINENEKYIIAIKD